MPTTRLTFRPIGLEDADWLARLDRNNEVMRFIPRKADVWAENYGRQKAEDIIRRNKAQDPSSIFAVLERKTNKIIGWIGLFPLVDTSHIEIGYRFFPEFWGRGYATEGARHLLEYGFKTLGLNEIVAVTHPEHKASQRVLEKSGLRFIHHGRCGCCTIDLAIIFDACREFESAVTVWL